MSVAFQKQPQARGMGPFIPFSKSPSRVQEIESSVVAMAMTPDEVDENNNAIDSEMSTKQQQPRPWSSLAKEQCGVVSHRNGALVRRCSGTRSEFTDDEDSDTKPSELSDDDALVICEDKCTPPRLNYGHPESSIRESNCHISPFSVETKGNSRAQDDQDQETVFALEGFSHYFPHNLHTLHKRRLFCDVTVRAHNRMVHGHKVVLAACSPYFYNALEKNQSAQSQTQETGGEISSHSYIDLGTSISPTGLETVIDSMYSSTIALRLDTVKEISEAAAHLDMQLVVAACLKFLQNRCEPTEDIKQARNVQDFSATKRETEAPIDLTASSNSSNAALNVGGKISGFKSDTEATDSGNSRETPSESNSTPDTDREIVYQNVSPCKSDVASPSPTTIVGKDDKYVTNALPEQTVADDTKLDYGKEKLTTSSEKKNCRHYAPDEDDEVFIKKESPRSAPAGADSGVQDTTPSHGAFSAGLFRHELYHRAIANSPYLLNAEAMAAAVAMSTLTSSLRSPHDPKQMPIRRPERSPLIMNPWRHILGQRLPHSLPRVDFSRPPPIDAFARAAAPTRADILQEQKRRHQALVNLASSAHGFAPGQPPPPPGPDVTRRISNDLSPMTSCSPLLLSSLLQASNTGPPHRMKRSYSGTAMERAIDAQKRFSSSRPSFIDSRKSSRFFSSGANDELEYPQQRKRRSTNSSSGSPDRPYKCLVCAAEFNRPANLKTHMRIHSGEKPYKCQSCGARFVQVAHLRAHILIHTGEKPYPCKICGTRFRHLQTLKSHLRIHTGEKPYACEECQVRFRHKSQLRLHLRTKHGINTNTKKTYQQVPGLNNADINAHIKRTQEAVRMQAHRKQF